MAISAAKKKNAQPSMSRALVRQETIAGYLFLLPSLVFFLGFVIYPMVMCVFTSFFDSTMNRADVFVGLQNYIELFQDSVFLGALRNTLIIVIVSVPITCIFSLWVASAIVNMPSVGNVHLPRYLLPARRYRLRRRYRRVEVDVQQLLRHLQLSSAKVMGVLDQNINWLGDSKYALACIILILLTTSVGQPIVLYVSALGNVDQSLVEAAEVDGATKLQAFWKIKWPQIMPTTLYILVITTINSFQCFALIQLLTSGGPNHATDTIMYYIYYTAFKLYRYGYGNAMGVILALMIAVLSAVQFKVTQSD